MNDLNVIQRATVLNNSADGLLKLGRAKEALALALEAVRNAEDLLGRNPDRDLYQRDLAKSYGRLGDVKKSVEGPATALVHYEKSFALNEELTGRIQVPRMQATWPVPILILAL